MRPLSLLLLAVVAQLALLDGCAAAAERQCSVGADCASGACSVDGKCVIVAKSDTGLPGTETSPADGATTEDDGVVTETGTPTEGGTTDGAAGCSPNQDGRIEAFEIPLRAGLKATFRVAENATFATAGTALGADTRKWDLSTAFTGDKDVLVTTKPVAGNWFASKYADATYVTELAASSDVLGVFRIDAGGLVLLGAASPKDTATKTDLKYATPPQILAFPLEVGKTWKTTSNVTGTANGLFASYSETYDAKVDAKGELVAPLGTFQVLRVKMILTRTVGLSTTTTRSYAFVSECFGTVANLVSKSNETAEEWSATSELRRLAP